MQKNKRKSDTLQSSSKFKCYDHFTQPISHILYPDSSRLMRTKIPPEKPHFFRPIQPGFRDGITIPVSFLKYLGGKISEKEAVLRRGVKEWRVKICDRCLREGWRKFALENNLQVGDFVVFEHKGNMVFEVLVFDPGHCEREHPSIDDERNSSEKFKAAEEAEEIPRNKEVNLRHSDQEEAISTNLFSYPYFISTVKPYNILHNRLNVPIDFAKENDLYNRECNTILRDRREWSWSVELKRDGRLVSLRRGWKLFREAQGLKEGDDFILELAKNGDTPIFNFYGKEDVPTARSGNEFSSHDGEPDNPHFISTIKAHSITYSMLYLPIKFAKSNDLSNRSCKLILRDTKKRSWPAELKPKGSRVCICGGLDEFFAANGLKEGDIFKFELVENGETPLVNFVINLTKDDHLQPQPRTQPRPLLAMKPNGKRKAKRLEASPEPDNDNHPYFVSTIKHSNLKKYALYLPSKFARLNGLTKSKGELILKDERQRPWKVKLEHSGSHVLLSRGWHNFSKANGLKEGDSYKFELFRKGERPVANFHREHSFLLDTCYIMLDQFNNKQNQVTFLKSE